MILWCPTRISSRNTVCHLSFPVLSSQVVFDLTKCVLCKVSTWDSFYPRLLNHGNTVEIVGHLPYLNEIYIIYIYQNFGPLRGPSSRCVSMSEKGGTHIKKVGHTKRGGCTSKWWGLTLKRGTHIKKGGCTLKRGTHIKKVDAH